MHAVGEMTDGNRVGIRIVVFLQHVVIRRHDKSWSAGAAGEEQDAVARAWKRFAVGAPDAKFDPAREAVAAVHIVEALRHTDFETPGQAVLPFSLVQIVA